MEKGCQNKKSKGKLVLAESQAPEGDEISKSQFRRAKAVRLTQLPSVCGASYIRLYLALVKHKLPYVHVATGTKGRPPIEIEKDVALQLKAIVTGKPANVVTAEDKVVVPEPTVEPTVEPAA